MNLLNDNSDIIKEIIYKGILEKNIELEYLYGNNKTKLSKEKFMNLINYCNKNLVQLNNTMTLDITTETTSYKKNAYENIRITLKNLDSIKEYCKKEEIDDSMEIEIIEKKIYDKKYKLQSKNYNYRINLKNEEKLNKEDSKIIDILNEWKTLNKFFRYKKRLSYITNDGLFRIDLTGIKNNTYNEKMKSYYLFKTFKENNILNNPESYELEIEYVGNNYKINNIFNIINFIDYINLDKEYGYKNDKIYESVEVSTSTAINPINEIQEDIFTDDLYEYINNEINEKIINKIYESFNNIIYDITKVIENKEIILSKQEIDEILNSYYKLTNQKSKNKILIGPQPINLTYNNLTNNLENHLCIYKNYLVTEKADGERYLLYINNKKEGYLINKKSLTINNYYELINTGYIFEDIEGEWLLDGEYITKDKNKEDIKMFLIFDVYYENGKKAYNYPFLSKKKSRLEILEEFKTILDNKKINEKYSKYIENNIIIDIKEYYEGDIIEDINSKNYEKNKKIILKNKKILKQSKRILDNEKNNSYPYKIDGLIYLSSNLPVGATYYNNEAPELLTGTWNYNYKWKPSKENTIDFKVNIIKDSKTMYKKYPYEETNTNGEVTINYYNKVILKVIYDEYKDDDIDFCMKTLNGDFPKERSRNNINLVKFDIKDSKIDIGQTNIKLTNNRMICIDDKNEINDGDVIEMKYSKKSENGMNWIPMRQRKDKLGKPQADWVAKRIWDTIQNPIKDEYIMGKEDIPSDIFTELEINENYYIDENFISPSEPLRKFHNYIKSKLIGAIGTTEELPKDKYILDTSIGRGGDLKKYLMDNINTKFLLGLDISSINEACKRFYFNNNKKVKAAFIQYDTSKNIINEEGYININDYSRQIMNIIYEKNNEIMPEFKNISKRYNGLASKGFNIISSQFTLHYYFKDKKTLTGFLENISENCKKNGLFIGCCYDGNRIFEKLKKLGTDNFIYQKKGSKLPIYNIIKKYNIENFDFDINEPDKNMLGNTIEVFMDSIGSYIEEYLVNYDYLIYMMKEYGFEPYLPEINKNYKEIFTKPIDSFETIIDKLPELKNNDNELQNIKIYKNALNILNDNELKELSKMNNYFIFKKI